MRNPTIDSEALEAAVLGARNGDSEAWHELYRLLDGRLRAMAAAKFRLQAADIDDVVQTAWLRLVDHFETIREPRAVLAWMRTTTSNNCVSLVSRSPASREVPTEHDKLERASVNDDPEAAVISREVEQVLTQAVSHLVGRRRQLIDLVRNDSLDSYQATSVELDMPVGSIGPTLGRAYYELRRDHAVAALA